MIPEQELGRQVAVLSSGPQVINPEYQYVDGDVDLILAARVSQERAAHPDIFREDGWLQALAAVDNRPGQLETNLDQNRIAFPGPRMILIPYNAGYNHWISILLELDHDDRITQAKHMDSLGCNDLEEIQDRLTAWVRAKLIQRGKAVESARYTCVVQVLTLMHK